MRIKNRPTSLQVQTECNLVMATVEAEVQEGEHNGIRGNNRHPLRCKSECR